MSEILTPIFYQLGVGGFGGFLVGYAIKKIAKIVAVILGIFFLALLYLGFEGIIVINYNRLAERVSELLGALGTSGDALAPLTLITSHLPFAASFSAGFAMGLKIG